MERRGRPTIEQQAKKKAALEAQQKLFDTEPFTVSLPKKKIRYPQTVSTEDWLKWVFEYLVLNSDVVSLLDIYEDENITPTMSFLDTVNAHDPNIENLIEQRIINKTLKGEIRSVFATALLKQKYNWTEDSSNNVSLNSDEINFSFG